MSELNLALQAVGMMTEKLATATLEKVLEGCNSMKDIPTDAKNHPALQDEFRDKVQLPIIIAVITFPEVKIER